MALVTDKIVFLHVPKTAGIWIRHVFKHLKISHSEVGDQHTHFPELLQYKPEEYFRSRYVFTFIRHPLTWYQSRWAFRMKHGWKLQHPLDYSCASNDFHTFVKSALITFPTGWVSNEYSNYIDCVPGGINFVGHTETLITDLVYALNISGEMNVAPERLAAIPPANDSNIDGRPSHFWARYTKDLAQQVETVEQATIKCYYRDISLSPTVLYGPAGS